MKGISVLVSILGITLIVFSCYVFNGQSPVIATGTTRQVLNWEGTSTRRQQGHGACSNSSCLPSKHIFKAINITRRGHDVDRILRSLKSVSPNHPSTNEKLWIELNNKRMLIRRTVYFDARPNIGPAVVIISLHNDWEELKMPTFYARLTLHNNREECVKVNVWKKIGYVKIIWNDYYVGYLMRIKLAEGIRPPLFIELTSSLSNCYSHTNLLPPMPVFSDERNKEGKFAVCAAKALFNDHYVDPEWIVHWVEFQRTLGASYITMFIQDISDRLYEAMRPYMKEGLVEVIDWRVSVSIHEKGTWGSLQECIYRNVNRAQYLTVHDSDEILVPQKRNLWSEMIVDLAEQFNLSNYASLSFYNAFWFDIGLPIEKAVEMSCPKMKSLPLYFKRTDRVVNPEHKHPKYMVFLDRTYAGNIHEIAHWKEGLEMRLKVPIDIGQSHHFRTPVRAQDYERHNRHYDPEFMEPYVEILMGNIRQKLC